MSVTLPMLLVAAGSFVIGIVGFAQVLWSMKKAKVRGMGLTIGTAGVWSVILAVCAILVVKFLPDYVNSLLIGYVVSFLILVVAQVMQK